MAWVILFFQMSKMGNITYKLENHCLRAFKNKTLHSKSASYHPCNRYIPKSIPKDKTDSSTISVFHRKNFKTVFLFKTFLQFDPNKKSVESS